jgi:hypothetical protein
MLTVALFPDYPLQILQAKVFLDTHTMHPVQVRLLLFKVLEKNTDDAEDAVDL